MTGFKQFHCCFGSTSRGCNLLAEFCYVLITLHSHGTGTVCGMQCELGRDIRWQTQEFTPIAIEGEEPRAMAVSSDGSEVYVAILAPRPRRRQ